ncbi:MAG: TolC family protein [Burkholderiales bacterium]
MRRLLLPLGLAATCLFSPLFVQARPAPSFNTTLTLEQAQALAAERSFALSAARHELAASDGALRQAGALPNPTLNALVEDTRSASRTTTATLDLAVELGGKRAARLHVANHAQALAAAELRGAQAQLRADVVQAFFGVLIAQQRARIGANSAALAERGADAVGRRVAAGKVSPVDETRARVDLANAVLEAAEAESGLQSARATLAALWGDAEPRFDAVSGEVETLPARPAAAALAAELDAAPALVASQLETERRRALIDVERSKQLPDLTVSMGAKRDNELGRTQAIVGLSIPLPLFDRNQGATIEAARRADKAFDEHQLARIRLLNELQHASAQLALANTSAQTLQTRVLPAATQAHDAAVKGFEAGKFAFTDVLDAQRALLQARARHLDTLAAAHQAAATIDRLLGR